jgi:NADP-reducing hydrogenase subunit HndD
MMGAIIKSYYAKQSNLDPKDIFVVSIMPCTAKKYEKNRPANRVNGINDVDCVLTTRELGRLIKRSGINWDLLPEEKFDQDLLGEYTGAGVIFGVTGGVMEAALRTAYHTLMGQERDLITFNEVRTLSGVKEASLEINGITVKVAVVSGMANAKPLLDQIANHTSPYHFIELMGCPSGCINGGGQPYVKPTLLPKESLDILDTYIAKRASVLYSIDEKAVVRQSHRNQDIIKLYQEFLHQPGSHEAHELLHTHFEKNRARYQ